MERKIEILARTLENVVQDNQHLAREVRDLRSRITTLETKFDDAFDSGVESIHSSDVEFLSDDAAEEGEEASEEGEVKEEPSLKRKRSTDSE